MITRGRIVAATGGLVALAASEPGSAGAHEKPTVPQTVVRWHDKQQA